MAKYRIKIVQKKDGTIFFYPQRYHGWFLGWVGFSVMGGSDTCFSEIEQAEFFIQKKKDFEVEKETYKYID